MLKPFTLMISLILGLSFQAHAIDDDIDLDTVTLADLLMNTKTTVASQKATNTLTAPGIVSVITADEIERLGARDLIDVLYMIPGFNMNSDIYNTDGYSIRGLPALEGRMLVLIDGMMMNDIAYGNYAFANRHPVSQIERVEVIRGPGSAIYGGFAELAVVNITTRGAAGKKGTVIGGVWGQMPGATARQTLNLFHGSSIGKWNYDLGFFYGKGNRSDKDASVQDNAGAVKNYNLSEWSETLPFYLNMGVQRGGFSGRFIIDHYDVENRHGYGYQLLNYAFNTGFHSYNLNLKYDWRINDKLVIVPSYTYKFDEPWQVKEDWTIPFAGFFFDIDLQRHVFQVKGIYDPTPRLNVVFGVEHMSDYAEAVSPTAQFKTTAIGDLDVNYFSAAVFTQAQMETSWANFTAGLRWEDHSAFDNSLVPRFAATRQFGKFHAKALYSQAYRNPAVKNIDSFNATSGSLRPEEVSTFELEGGYQISDSQAVTANYFDTTINYPLAYDSASDSYSSEDKLATRGYEVEYRLRRGWGFGTLNYSYYTIIQNDIPAYTPNSDSGEVLGNPKHKIAGLLSYRVRSNFSINPSVVWLSSAYTDEYNPTTFADEEIQEESRLLLNLNFRLQDVGSIKGLDVGLGVFNILNQAQRYMLPYRSEADDLWAPSREIVARVGYNVPF